MKNTINTLQMMQFELMEHATLEGFAAKRVITDLIAHRNLWESAIMMPDPTWGLLHVRDLNENKWNVDCLYILSTTDETQALTEVAQSWQPRELQWIAEDTQATLMRVPERPSGRVLRLFW